MQVSGLQVLFQGNNLLRLLKGLLVTINISVVSILISVVLGFLFGFIMISRFRVIRFISQIYLEFIRIMPQLVLLFLVYFGLARTFNLNLSGEVAALIVFSMWGTAEMGDLVRGALTSLPKHQIESGLALGLNNRQLFIYVVIPQILRQLLPQAVNLMTRMIKTTSLIILIGVVEVVKVGQEIIEANRLTVPSTAIWIYGLFCCLFSNLEIVSLFRKTLEGVNHLATILELKDIEKSYGEQKILNQVSFSVEEGEVLVILGPSGCGKSTLLRCINGLEPIQAGRVELEGKEILKESKNLPLVRQKIGMVFQSYDLFPHLTVLKNLLLAPVKVQKRSVEEVKGEALKLLKRVGLEGKENSYPHELSGGQMQRVAIVRSLLLHPEVLLFDEVTASLDPEMVREVLELIGELAHEGRTMIIVTHELQFAKAIADRVIFLEKGQIVEESDARLFFRQPRTQRARDFLNVFDFSTVG